MQSVISVGVPLLPESHRTRRIHYAVLVRRGCRHTRPLGRAQRHGPINGLFPNLGFDGTLDWGIALKHLVLLGTGANAHTLIERTQSPKLGGIMRLARRSLNNRGIRQQQAGGNVMLPGQFVPLLPQRLGDGQSLRITAQLGDAGNAQPRNRMGFARGESFGQCMGKFLFSPLVLAGGSQITAHQVFELDQHFHVKRRIVAPVSWQRAVGPVSRRMFLGQSDAKIMFSDGG